MTESLYPKYKYEYGTKKTEIEVLKAAHKFLRSADEDASKLGWDDALAHKYYSSLYREFAVCDLKHFKTGNISLRWRTEDEVISGIGETTCGNTRCKYHAGSRDTNPSSSANRRWDDDNEEEMSDTIATKENQPKLITLELPFAYEEDSEQKSALVKVVLCERCTKKLNWKREKEKKRKAAEIEDIVAEATQEQPSRRSRSPARPKKDKGSKGRSRRSRDDEKQRRRYT